MKKIIISVLIIVIAFLVLLLFIKRYVNKTTIPSIPEVSKNLTPNEKNSSVSMDSPDGKATLTMKTTTDKNSITYFFSTSNLIYTKITTKDDVFSIPFNTWSPDKKYVFLKETKGSTTNFLLLNATGAPFKDNSQFINVSDVFAQKLPIYTLTDTTGWAAGTLLIINTNKADGSEGPSFWFDLSSSTFIQLSNRFN